jgi:hypothetical protein
MSSKVPLELLNNQASNSFEKIKNKSIWRAVSANVLANQPVNRDRISEACVALEDTGGDLVETTNDISTHKAKSVLEFLDELELDGELKIAISYIIASGDKEKRANLGKAMMILDKEHKKL